MSYVQLPVLPVLLGSSVSFLVKISFPYWGEGIKTSLFLLILCDFLPKERKGIHLSAPGAIQSCLGKTISSVSINAILHPDGHLYIYHVFGDGTMEVVEDKVTLSSDVEIHSGKVSWLTYTVS